MVAEILTHYLRSIPGPSETERVSWQYCDGPMWGFVASRIFLITWKGLSSFIVAERCDGSDVYDYDRLDLLDAFRILESDMNQYLHGNDRAHMHHAWLLHWSLFVAFNAQSGRALRDWSHSFILSDRSLTAILSECPHLLRYVAVCLLFRSSRSDINQHSAARALREGRASYSDPTTCFTELACAAAGNNGGEGVTEIDWLHRRRRIEHICRIDFFLRGFTGDLETSMRRFVSKPSCTDILLHSGC